MSIKNVSILSYAVKYASNFYDPFRDAVGSKKKLKGDSIMKFTEEQLVPESAGGLASKDLLERDVSKINRQIPLTSDQHLFEISNIKEAINKQILSAIKGVIIPMFCSYKE